MAELDDMERDRHIIEATTDLRKENARLRAELAAAKKENERLTSELEAAKEG